MKKWILKLTLPVFALCIIESAMADTTTQFEALLKESGLVYSMPQGFSEHEEETTQSFDSEKQLVSEDGFIAVHYHVRPVGTIEREADDQKSTKSLPAKTYEKQFISLAQPLAKNGAFKSLAYSPERTLELFNADWAAVAIFDLQSSVSEEYKVGLLLGIHRKDRADAYTLFLTKDLEASKPLITESMTGLRFEP